MLLLKIQKDSLVKPLNNLINIVERRHSLPILMNILLSFNKGSLKLTTSDIEIEISSTINIDQQLNEQEITVSARKFLDILKNMNSDDLVELSVQKNKLFIFQKNSKYSLQILPAEDFPLINLPPIPKDTISARQDNLKKLINSISFSMAYQDVRYYLNGLFIKFDTEYIIAVATDGHRLAINSEEINQTEKSIQLEFIVPRKAVIEIEKMCNETEENINLYFYAQHLKIEVGSFQLITKLIDGKYPDYTKVIPEKTQTYIDINRQEFLTGLQRVSILTADKYRGIKLHVKGNKILLQSTNAEQEEAEEQISCSDNQLDIKMGFNVTYLIDVLSNLKSETVQLLLSDPQSSALVLDSNHQNFKYVVMPMRI